MPDSVPHCVPYSPAVILAADSPQAAGAVPVPLRASSVSEERVRLGRMVRRGCYRQLADARFSVAFAEDDGQWSGALALAGPAGRIEIADGARLLQGLTGIDPDPGAGQPWLAAALAGRLAHTPLAGLSVAAPGAVDGHCLRLTLRSRTHMITSLARAALPVWIDLLARADWSFEHGPARPWLALASDDAVVLAQHTLAAGALRTLSPGDVILPDSPRFRPDGIGRIHLGGRPVQVRYAAPNSLELIELEPTVTTEEQVNDDTAAAIFADIDTAQAPESEPESEFDPLPVTLSFELGKVALPLGELRTLGPGAVVLFEGCSPASVAIVAGGQTLGRGEIVDVAGQLGIRVTRWSAPC